MWLVITVLLRRQVGQATPARPSGPGGGSPPDRTDRPFDRTAGSAGSHLATIWRRQNRGRSRGGRPSFGTVTPKDHDLWLDCWPRRGMEPMLPSRARREGWSASADHGAKGDGMATSSASDANVLSCRERRVLADIEDDLAASDPRGADEMGRRSPSRHRDGGRCPRAARCCSLCSSCSSSHRSSFRLREGAALGVIKTVVVVPGSCYACPSNANPAGALLDRRNEGSEICANDSSSRSCRAGSAPACH
jgi:hypothetical protein